MVNIISDICTCIAWNIWLKAVGDRKTAAFFNSCLGKNLSPVLSHQHSYMNLHDSTSCVCMTPGDVCACVHVCAIRPCIPSTSNLRNNWMDFLDTNVLGMMIDLRARHFGILKKFKMADMCRN